MSVETRIPSAEGMKARGHEGTLDVASAVQGAATAQYRLPNLAPLRALAPLCPRALSVLVYAAMLAPTIACADPIPMHAPAPSEFAVQLPLEVSGNNGVVQLLLPIEVYQHSQSADLADLRVYNSAGVALPYALHRPSYRTRIQFREGNAALFPIYDHAQPGTGGSNLELQLRSGADGSLLTVRSPDAVAASDRLSALIIDLGPSDRAEVLESLAFDLPEATSDYQAHLAIERSDDLKLWDGVAYGAIDWLSGADAGQRLVNDRVDLPNGDGRYLKVRWIDGEPVQFGAVHTRWRSATAALDPTLQVELAAQPGRVAGDFVYAASPAIAATAIGLDLPEANTVMPVTIGFYREQRVPKPQWWLAPSLDTTFYRLNHDGRERVSSRINIAPLSGAEWVVRPHTAGHAPPKLVLRWQPQTLVFNAQGSDFKLAVGAPSEVYRRWLGGPSPMDQVAPGFSRDEIEQLERAQVGVLMQTPRAAPAAVVAEVDSSAEAARTRRFVLWSVLALGVLVLGYMTWRLYAQLSAEKN